MYIFSLRDLVLYRKDGTEPWVDVVGYNQKLQYIPKVMLPIFNSTGEKNCWDIPIPTYEDWNYVSDPEYKAKFQDIVLDWNKKKPTAIFRGGAAGCGYNAKTNARIGLAKLSQRLRLQGKADILDAGIIAGKNKKFKFYRDNVNSRIVNAFTNSSADLVTNTVYDCFSLNNDKKTEFIDILD
jgi:hypothetical protein